MVETGNDSRGGLYAIVGDAAFLACSWTWCIGMYLPAVLLRDYGIWSFVAFALPNCIGAAAMAWWIGDSERSRQFVVTHAWAIRVFSYVTIAFQWFFAAWLLRNLGFSVWTLGAIAAGVATYLTVPVRLLDDKPRRIVSVLVWCVSVALLATWAIMNQDQATTANLPRPLLDARTWTGHTGSHVAPLAAVCLLGFSLCPLLDVTFHMTVQRSKAPRATFALGFLVMFIVMILGTLLYGAQLVRDGAASAVSIAPAGVAWLVVFHMAVQLAFTLASHERGVTQEVAGLDRAPTRGVSMAVPVATVIGVVLALIATMAGPLPAWQPPPPKGDAALPGLTNMEFIYRGFMTFYAVAVPLYVLGCAAPWRGRRAGWSLHRGMILGAGLLGAMPLYYLGFVARRSENLWYGVGVVMVFGAVAACVPGGKRA